MKNELTDCIGIFLLDILKKGGNKSFLKRGDEIIGKLGISLSISQIEKE